MEDTMKIEIKIISKEIIKPSSPTPSHLKTLKLSLFDQLFPVFHLPILLFYNAPSKTPPLQITNLKSSLSYTLSHFYPLAGRCIDEDTVSCNDEGIPFIETHVNSPLTEFLASSHKLDFLSELLPPREILSSGSPLISDMVPLAFQINVFACGGIVIGCFMFHKLLDILSLGTFFHYWAATAAQQFHNVVDPTFDLIVKGFPPLSSLDRVKVMEPLKDTIAKFRPISVLVKSFRFTKTAINDLKIMAATEAHPNPTTFETLTGFIWESVIAAAIIARTAANEPVSETTAVVMSINIRTRTNPPLPRNSMGNCVADMISNATIQGRLPELVAEIHSTILKGKSRIEVVYQDVNGVEEILKDRRSAEKAFCQDNPSVYHVSSWCKLGLSEADFGFGKPMWIVPTYNGKLPMFRNYIFLTDYYDDLNGDGIEAWLFLEEKEMQVLETNPRFLQFASPY
ncbi:vinorine synthase-like [Silene latifolia]|uniref:vinorine synthase-like n=1 Tax=Silene latifolia TaxID=37657 RepID=UPI003D7777AC